MSDLSYFRSNFVSTQQWIWGIIFSKKTTSSSEHPVQLDVIRWGDTGCVMMMMMILKSYYRSGALSVAAGSGYTHTHTHTGCDWHSEGVGTQGGVSSRERRRRDSQLEPNPETRQQTHTERRQGRRKEGLFLDAGDMISVIRRGKESTLLL